MTGRSEEDNEGSRKRRRAGKERGITVRQQTKALFEVSAQPRVLCVRARVLGLVRSFRRY